MNDIDFARLTKRASKTFYFSSLFFPRKIRNDVFILYSFLRTGDDMVDSIPQQKIAFDKYKSETLNAISHGLKTTNPIISAFFTVYHKYRFNPNWIKAYFQSMETDLTIKNHSIASLNTFIYGSAEVVGMMMATVMGTPKKGLHAARLLGKGMQLINFIRDMKEDEDMGRRYIPSEDLKKYQIPVSQKINTWNQNQLNELVQYKIIQAIGLLNQAEQGFIYIPDAYRRSIEIACNLYRWTGLKIKQNPALVLKKKVKPSLWTIVLFAIKSIF